MPKKDPLLDANADEDELPDYIAIGAGGEYVFDLQSLFTEADAKNEDWILNKSPWQAIEVMIVGASGKYFGQPVAASNETNKGMAAGISNPEVMRQYATAFDYAEKAYRNIGNTLHALTEALTGETGPWRGPAAKKFASVITVLGDECLACADSLAATSIHLPLAQQVADDAASLEGARALTVEVDDFYGKQLEAASGIVIGDSSGKQTHGRFAAFLVELEQLLKRDLISIIHAVNKNYMVTVGAVVPPPNIKDPFAAGGDDSGDSGGNNSTGTNLPDELDNLLGNLGNLDNLGNLGDLGKLGNLGAGLGNQGGAGPSGADLGDLGKLGDQGGADAGAGAGGADPGAGAAIPDASSVLNGTPDLPGIGGAGSGEGLGAGDASLVDSGISPVASGISGLTGLGGLGGLSGLNKAGSSSADKDKSTGSAGLSGVPGLSGVGTDLTDQAHLPSVSASGLTGLDDAGSDFSLSDGALDTSGIPTVGAASDADLAALGGIGTSTGTGSTGMSLGDDALAASSVPVAGTATAGSAGTTASGGMPYMPMGGMGGAGAAAAGAQGAGERSEASGLMSRASDPWEEGLDLSEDGIDSAIGVSAGGAVLELSGAGTGTSDSSADEAAPVAPAVGMPYLPVGGLATGAAPAGQASGRSSTERSDDAGVPAAQQEPWTASEEELRAAEAQFAAGAEPGTAALDLPRAARPTAMREGGEAASAAAARTAGTGEPAAHATSAALTGIVGAAATQPPPVGAPPAPAAAAAAAPGHTAGAALDETAPDEGVPDGGAPDRGAPDEGAPDEGAPDGGAPDGGVPDGGVPDGGVPDDETAAWAVAPGALLPLLWQGQPGGRQDEREQEGPEPGDATADGGSGRAIWRPEQSSTEPAPDRSTQETGPMTMAQAVVRMQEAIDRAEAEEAEGGENTDPDSSSGEATPQDEDPDRRRDISALLRQDEGAWGSPTGSNLFT
ncbi:hypothetical protein AB0O75_46770 [Streptomyces sp. NPDC088921]|uniref:hypothetical protein n=1 Tax=unclassified Streptomyces TaxID=2593676 RepID=UPI003427CD01